MKSHRCFAYLVSPPAMLPSLVSLNRNLGDTVEDFARVVFQVDDSTGMTSAALDGVNVTSFAIDDGTHVSGFPVAHAAGLVNATVTNSNGTSAPLVNGYEYWDPTVPGPPASFFDRGDYALNTVLAVPNIGQWTKRAGSLDVEMVNIALSASGSPAVSAEGTPDFQGAGAAHRLNFAKASDHATNVTVEQLFGGSDTTISGTWLFVLDVDSINGSGATVYKGNAVIYDDQNRGGLVFDTTPLVRWFWFGGGFHGSNTQLTCPSSGKMAVAVRRHGDPTTPTIEISLDGVTWASDANTAVTGSNATIVGFDPPEGGTSYYDGRFRAFVSHDTLAWSDSDITKFFKWVAARHP